MKMRFSEMSKTEQWIICTIDHDLITKIVEQENDGLDIEFKVNGIDIPFHDVVKRIEEGYDKNVNDESARRTSIRDSFLSKIQTLRELSLELYQSLDSIDQRQE
jgi:hypothetical protein